MEKITSRDNRRLVHARKVREGKISSQIFIEGRRLVGESLRSDLTIDECFVSESFRDDDLLDAVTKNTNSIAEIPDRICRALADTDRPQGIILIATRPTTSSDLIELRLGSSTLPIVIFLKEINNPSNLGAIFRVAEASGVTGIVVSTNSVDVYSPKAIRAAMGSSFRLPVWEKAGFEEVLCLSLIHI